MREIKFRAWDGISMLAWTEINYHPGWRLFPNRPQYPDWRIMQYTGLKDKNGLHEVYEGDIISSEGDITGNVYEGEIRQGTDFVVEGMGTKSWRDTEQEAVKRGCHYAE